MEALFVCEHCNHTTIENKKSRFEDLTGKKFGYLTVLHRVENHRNGRIMWLCECECGNTRKVTSHDLKDGTVKHCGCKRIKYSIGEHFNEWTVIDRIQTKDGKYKWLCECSCGTRRTFKSLTTLKNGKSKSCGCKQYKDLTGRHFGDWTVLKLAERGRNGEIRWLCQCKCGTVRSVSARRLASGVTTSCGCSKNKKSLIGESFGELTVIDRYKNVKSVDIWVCRCTCGQIINVDGVELRQDRVTDCGCKKYSYLLGQSFGEFTVLRYIGRDKNGKAIFECQCSCGAIKECYYDLLIKRIDKGCRCIEKYDELVGKTIGDLTILEKCSYSDDSIYFKCQCLCGALESISIKDLFDSTKNKCSHSGFNIIGQTFGRFTVLKYHHKAPNGDTFWECEDNKGKIVIKSRPRLLEDRLIASINHNPYDISQQKFGNLTVIRQEGFDENEYPLWICQCVCGTFKKLTKYAILREKDRECHCKNKVKIGQKINHLTVVGIVEIGPRGGCTWLCQCDCGECCEVRSQDLSSGKVKSCGKCIKSYGESTIANFLDFNSIAYQREYWFDDLRGRKKKPLRFDFCLHNAKNELFLIEFQGEQHYKEKKSRPEFGKEQREKTDPQKKKYCKKNNIRLYEIKWNEDIEKCLRYILFKEGLLTPEMEFKNKIFARYKNLLPCRQQQTSTKTLIA